jgi:hypothetical protein
MTLEAILDEVDQLHNVNKRLEGAVAALSPPEPFRDDSELAVGGRLGTSWQKVEPMSLLSNRAFYPNLVRATMAGNGVTMAGAFVNRFSHKLWLLFPFGDHGVGALGDVVFNTCWVFALICVGTILRQSYSSQGRSQVRR